MEFVLSLSPLLMADGFQLQLPQILCEALREAYSE